MPVFNDMTTWTEGLARTSLRTYIDEANRFWLEQNAAKRSRWAALARKGHAIAWEFDNSDGSYTGRLLIDGTIYTTSEATKKFLK
jgi:hypothetical protein